MLYFSKKALFDNVNIHSEKTVLEKIVACILSHKRNASRDYHSLLQLLSFSEKVVASNSHPSSRVATWEEICFSI